MVRGPDADSWIGSCFDGGGQTWYEGLPVEPPGQ